MNTIGIPPVRAVIFDMDGLLLDTEVLYTEATQAIAARYGKVYDWSIKRHALGLGAIPSARVVIDALALPMTPEAFIDERNALLRERFPHARAMPGARALVEHLARHGVPMAVATSSARPMLELKASAHQDWFVHFDAIVTADDPQVGAAKPAPDLFAVAARRIAADPSRTLAFEDSPSGVQSAVAAGMRVIAVPDPAMDAARYPQASQILRSLSEFDPARWGLAALG